MRAPPAAGGGAGAGAAGAALPALAALPAPAALAALVALAALAALAGLAVLQRRRARGQGAPEEAGGQSGARGTGHGGGRAPDRRPRRRGPRRPRARGLAGGARPPGAAGTPCRALEPRQGQLVETTVGGVRVLGGAAGGLRRGGRLGVAAAPRPLGGRRGTGARRGAFFSGPRPSVRVQPRRGAAELRGGAGRRPGVLSVRVGPGGELRSDHQRGHRRGWAAGGRGSGPKGVCSRARTRGGRAGWARPRALRPGCRGGGGGCRAPQAARRPRS